MPSARSVIFRSLVSLLFCWRLKPARRSRRPRSCMFPDTELWKSFRRSRHSLGHHDCGRRSDTHQTGDEEARAILMLAKKHGAAEKGFEVSQLKLSWATTTNFAGKFTPSSGM